MLFSTDLRLSTDGLYTVGCPSNGRRAPSISALPALAAQTSTSGTACSLLPVASYAAAQPSPPHRTPIAGLAIPLLTLTCCYSPAMAEEPVIPRTVVLPSAWETKTTTESSLPPCRSLPRPRCLPPPCAFGAAWTTWSTTDMHLKWTVRGEADCWVHGRTQGTASLLRAK